MYAENLPQRSLPQDVEAEEAVLGSILIDSSYLNRVMPWLAVDDFSREKNRWIYEACRELYSRSVAIDQRTIAHELSRMERLSLAGGDAYLSQLVTVVPTPIHIEHYGKIVRDAAVMRRLIKAAEDISNIGYSNQPIVDDAITKAEDVLFRLRTGSEKQGFVALKEVLSNYYVETKPGSTNREHELPHVPSGFIDLDKLMGGGLQRSDLLILAARPAMGKSSLALSIAKNAASRGARVGLFSLEMGREQIAYRLVSMQTAIDMQRIRLNNTRGNEEDRIDQAIDELSQLAIWIDDSATLSPMEMRSKIHRLSLEVRGLDLIIVDYIQLMGSVGNKFNNRVQEMSEISRAIKAMAKEFNVPVVALSKLNRAVKMRQDHKPQLADLRESGSIEQDADIVMFIFREAYYTTKEAWERLHPGPNEPYPEHIAQIIVAKHRHGPPGEVSLRFDSRIATFQDLQKIAG